MKKILISLLNTVLILILQSIPSKAVLTEISKELPSSVTLADISGWTVTKGGANQAISVVTGCYHGSGMGFIEKDSIVKKTFNSLPPHYSVSFSVSMSILFNWNNTPIEIYSDTTKVYRKSFSRNFNPFMDDDGQGPMCPGGNSATDKAVMVPASFNVTHGNTDWSIEIHTNNAHKDAFLLLNDFFLYVDTCHFTCATCSGPAEDQCTSCPGGSRDYSGAYGKCRCPLGQYSYDFQCINACPAGYFENKVTRTCHKTCLADKCATCVTGEELVCQTCDTGYFLLNGRCYDQCPFFTTTSGTNCVDATFNSMSRAQIAAQDYVNKQFTHQEVAQLGYTFDNIEYDANTGYQTSNYAFYDCAGKSYAHGYGAQTVPCTGQCGMWQTFQLPPHFQMSVKFDFMYGDSWNGASQDTFRFYVDGTVEASGTHNYQTNGNYDNDICGIFAGWTDVEQQFVIGPYAHTDTALDLRFDYAFDQHFMNEWPGIRDFQVIISTCLEKCGSCSNDSSCNTCIPERDNPPNCDQPAPGYFDDGSGDLILPKCDSECATCSGSVDNCDTCTDPLTTPPNCGKYTNCLNQVRVESGGLSWGGYHRVFLDNVNQNYASSRGMGITEFDELGQFVSFTNYNTADVYADTNNMIAYINSIPNGRRVLVGCFEECSYELSPVAYTALYSLGMDTNIVLDLNDGYAMIGTKGAAPGSSLQRHSPFGDTNDNAHVDECLIECISDCATCENRTDNCLSCSDPNDFLHYTPPANPCVNPCPDGFYGQTTPTRECVACPTGCATCSSSTVCNTCDPGYFMDGTMCVNPCPDGKWGNTVNQQCELCHNTCETCNPNGTDTDCILCQDVPLHYSHIAVDSKCYQTCPDPYYGDATLTPPTCVICPTGCASCTSNTVCTSCDPGYFMYGNMCVNPCPDGTWPNGLSQTCDPCHSTCETCNPNGTDTDCILCQDVPLHYSHQTVDSKCYALCPDPYYNDDTTSPVQCSQCDIVRCTSCFGPTHTECNSCTPAYNLNGNTCELICNVTCLTCQTFPDDKDICLSCDDPLYLLGTQCVVCPDGMWGQDLAGVRTCEDCPVECATCTDPLNCLTCEPGWYLYQGQCINPCPDGFFENDPTLTCDPCMNLCRTCDNDTQCTSCFPDRILDNFQCLVCEDYLGYYTDPLDPQNCLEICGDGIRVDPSTGCDDGNLIDGDGCSSICTIETGYECSGGTSYSRDRCINVDPIRFVITKADDKEIFYNVEKNHEFYVHIKFNKPFSLPLNDSLEQYIVVNIDGHPSTKYTVSVYQDPQYPQEYVVGFSFETTIRDRPISVSFTEPEKFIDKDGNTLQNRADYTYVKDYFYYNDTQRETVKNFNFWIELFIAFMFLYIVPLALLNKFWIMTNCLDNMQLIFLIGFINFRQPINGISFNKQIQAYQDFWMPNIFNFKEDENDVSTEGKFQYWNYSPHFLNNVGAIFMFLLVFMIVHVICRIALKIVQPMKGMDNAKYLLKIMVYEFYEVRLMHDIWSSFMGIFVSFAGLNYGGLKPNLSAFLAFIFGFTSFITPFLTIYITKRSKNYIFQMVNQIRQIGCYVSHDIDQKVKEDKSFRFRNLWHHINPEKTSSHYQVPLMYLRKIFYAHILVNLHESLTTQFVGLMILNILYLVYIVFSRPFYRISDNLRVILTEFLTFIAICLSIKMRIDDSEDEVKRYDDTWIIIGFLFSALVIHDVFLLYDTIQGLYYVTKRYCYDRQKYKVTNLRDKRNQSIVIPNKEINEDIQNYDPIALTSNIGSSKFINSQNQLVKNKKKGEVDVMSVASFQMDNFSDATSIASRARQRRGFKKNTNNSIQNSNFISDHSSGNQSQIQKTDNNFIETNTSKNNNFRLDTNNFGVTQGSEDFGLNTQQSFSKPRRNFSRAFSSRTPQNKKSMFNPNNNNKISSAGFSQFAQNAEQISSNNQSDSEVLSARSARRTRTGKKRQFGLNSSAIQQDSEENEPERIPNKSMFSNFQRQEFSEFGDDSDY